VTCSPSSVSLARMVIHQATMVMVQKDSIKNSSKTLFQSWP